MHAVTAVVFDGSTPVNQLDSDAVIERFDELPNAIRGLS